MVKNLSVAVLGLCFLKHVKELPWEGFLPDQGLSGIIIDLDTVRLDDNFFLAPLHHEILQWSTKELLSFASFHFSLKWSILILLVCKIDNHLHI